MTLDEKRWVKNVGWRTLDGEHWTTLDEKRWMTLGDVG